MNRLHKSLTQSKELISIYFTASYPHLESTMDTLIALQNAGVDMVELGIPFSDPLADGISIQQAHHQALVNGFTLENLLKQIQHCREQIEIPIIMMGYFNPILQFGIEAFVQKIVSIGIDGLIIPDLPTDVYASDYRTLFEEYAISFIPLLTPQSSQERILLANEVANTFIYLLSSSATTGHKIQHNATLENFFARNKDILTHAIMIGFGIRTHQDLAYVCRYAKGGIIGSAFIEAIKEGQNQNKSISDICQLFMRSLQA